jgi:hypothetical protein
MRVGNEDTQMDRGFAIVAGIPVETCGNSICQRDLHVAEGQRLCP